MAKSKTPSINLDFLLTPDVRFENCVSPTDDSRERFKMSDGNRRTVSGNAVLREFWSKHSKPATTAPAPSAAPR